MKSVNLSGTASALALFSLASSLFSGTPVNGQTMSLGALAEGRMNAPLGEYLVVDELPRPQWSTVFEISVARLRIKAPDAGAWRAAFRSMSLDPDAQIFFYGVDAAGGVQSKHGPYIGNGPVNVPEFQTQVIEGSELVIEVQGGTKSDEWPFDLESVERISVSQLQELKQQGMRVDASYSPGQPERAAREVRSTWFEDQVVRYQAIDGLAVAEGDIALGSIDEVEAGATTKGRRRNALEDSAASRRWPNGVVPFTIEYSQAIMPGSFREADILAAIRHWNQRFPGIIVPRTNQADYVTFRATADLCRAHLGRIGGQQFIWINTDCSVGGIVHELGHALGLWHEHQRPDRDQWVTIRWENVIPDQMFAFQIPGGGAARMHGEYDYESIMHYGRRASGMANRVTIDAPKGVPIGQRSGLSSGDEAVIRSRYCSTLTVSPGSFQTKALGGNYSFSIKTPPYCAWSFWQAASWIVITGPESGRGDGKLSFRLTPNNGQSRSGVIRVANGVTSATVTVVQQGENTNF